FPVVRANSEVVASLNCGYELGYLLGGILEIVIHRYDNRAAGNTKTTQERVMLSAVSKQASNLQARATVLEPLCDFPCIVRTGIVHDNDFEALSRLIEDCLESLY